VLGDTIWAVASPPGSAARGVIRISGPRALAIAGSIVESRELPGERRALDVRVTVLGRSVPGLALIMPGPASFTGEDVVELHLPGAPLLLATVGEELEACGARAATPGEFTRRAFLNGRLDLSAAEAVLDLIHAASADEARAALHAVRGGLGEAVDALRSRVDDARALLESGLDFTEDETGTVDTTEWLPLLDGAIAAARELAEGLPVARPGGELVLLGAANAGKSSLCNALAGGERVLVAELAGTTRDVITVEVAPGVTVADGPGDLEDENRATCEWERAALRLRDERVRAAGGALFVIDPTAPRPRVPDALGLPVVAVVLTRADLVEDPGSPPGLPRGVPVFRVSNRTGIGIAALRSFLASVARGGPAAGRSRARERIEGALEALERARALTATGGAETIAFELAVAGTCLDEVHGRSSPEDLLDRVFSRFCLGK
jgi:tRNA modification GTPase